MVNRLAGGGSSRTVSTRTLGGGGSFGSAPAPAPAPAPRPVPTNTAPPVPVWNAGGGGAGGGGGGGGAPAPAAAATAVAARPSLQDYISGNYLYKSAGDEGGRRLQEFDADTGRQQGLVQADQGVRRQQLQQTLDDQGLGNAEAMAGRGLLRSGLTFQNQDKINQFGNQQSNVIDQLLSTFVANRGGQRIQQEQANRQSIADAIAKITDQYTADFGA